MTSCKRHRQIDCGTLVPSRLTQLGAILTLVSGCGSGEPPSKSLTGVVSLSIQDSVACAVMLDGRARCVAEWLTATVSDAPAPLQSIVLVTPSQAFGLAQDGSMFRGAIEPESILADEVIPGSFRQMAPTSDYAIDALSTSGEVELLAQGSVPDLASLPTAHLAGYSCAIRADTRQPWCSRDAQVAPALPRDTPVETLVSRCWLYGDGQVECGATLSGNTPSVPMLALDLTPNRRVACGVRASDRAIECWGDRPDALVTSPPAGAFTDIALAGPGVDPAVGCAIEAETSNVTCWGGSPEFNQGLVEPAVDVAAGPDFACAVLANTGGIRCWGARTQPDGPQGDNDVAFVSAEIVTDRVCGLRADGGVSCWNTPGGDMLVEIAAAGSFSAIGSTAAVSSDGRLHLWAYPTLVPFAPAAQYTFVRTAESDPDEVCGILAKDETPRCWLVGADSSAPIKGKLGAARFELLRVAPRCNDGANAATPKGCESRSSGPAYRCGAIEETGELDCWGLAEDHPMIVNAPTLGEVDSLYLGPTVACAASRLGTTTCWGDDSNSIVSGAPDGVTFHNVTLQLAGRSVDEQSPRLGAESFMCGIGTARGEVICWGDVPTWLDGKL